MAAKKKVAKKARKVAEGRSEGRGEGLQAALRQDPDRQPRRDRLPRHPHLQAARHQDRRGLFRGRRRRAPCARGRREGADRPAALGAVLSPDRQDRGRLQEDRRPGGSPGLRLPLGEAGVPEGAGQGRHRLHRTRCLRHPRHGRQDRVQEARPEGRRQHRAGLPRRHPQCRGGGEDRPEGRLSGDDQGLGRRRRQGHAHRLQRRGDARGLRLGDQRGQGVVRRRPRVHREVHRGTAPHRDPAHRRWPRQLRLSLGARVLDPAPAPEGDRGGAQPLPRRQDAQGDGRAGGGAGQGGQIQERRHGRVHRRQAPQVLLPRDEHPPAGRASGDRADHRPRSRRADDQGRRRREAAVPAEGREARMAGRSRRGSMPRIRSATSCPRPDGW